MKAILGHRLVNTTMKYARIHENTVVKGDQVWPGASHSLHWHKICREAIAAGRGRSIAFTHQTQSILYTDGVYGVLSGTDVKGEISELGKAGNSSTSDEVGELKALVKQLLLKLGENEIG